MGNSELATFRGLKVLVVEDEETARQFLCDFMDLEGFSVEAAESLESSLVAVDQSQFDLILTDKNLPDGSGLEIARRFAGNPAITQVVMISAFASVDSTVEAMQLGVADFLIKPLTEFSILRARLSRVLSEQDLHRKNQALMADLKAKNEELESLVVLDPMTGLFNHSYFQEQLAIEIERARREGTEVSLALVDVDHFKDINDTLGHPAGDQFLKSFADLLRGDGRRFDMTFRLRAQDLAARYGGDEFALVLPSTPKFGASTKTERLRLAMRGFQIAGLALEDVSVSIGVASFPEDATDQDGLIAAADSALYASKRNGRNRLTTYHPDLAMGSHAQSRAIQSEKQWQLALQRTIDDRLVDYAYQPIVDPNQRTVFAYEALCRPRDDAFAHPGELFDAAVRGGQVIPLGRVLRQLAAEPLDRCPPEALLFVNLHPQELNDPQLVTPEPCFAGWADRVVFEITESEALGDLPRARRTLDALRAHGFRIALDDLGAGYAGINSLALLAPEFVKLDMQLVREIGRNERIARLVQHILDFSHGEGMRVVAEGIETKEELAAVLEMGCDFVQGYYYAKPQPPFASVNL